MTKRWDEDQIDRFEKIQKIRRKKKKSEKADKASAFVLSEPNWKKALSAGCFAARVVEVHKRYAFVSVERKAGEIDTADVWLGTIARRHLMAQRDERNFVCVGDRVLCRPAEISDTFESDLPRCIIENMAPRKTRIARIDPMINHREHVLASNIDQLIIVASYLKPKVKWGLIDRYLVLAETEHIPVLIVLTKRDLLELEANSEFRQDCYKRAEELQRVGYQVYSVQANLEEGVDSGISALGQQMQGKISLVSGHSGVGKSSLVNQFHPEIVQVVEENDDIFYKGRHTTTFASFIKLGNGGYVIDTPGIRSFALQDRDTLSLTPCFPEMRPFMGQCQFRECRHIEEPGCAIRSALEQGLISEWRYLSYVSILSGASSREGRIRDLDVDL